MAADICLTFRQVLILMTFAAFLGAIPGAALAKIGKTELKQRLGQVKSRVDPRQDAGGGKSKK